MTQIVTHQYREPDSTRKWNRRLVGLLPAGVYQGFEVHESGSIDPGVLLTAEGVRIEEDASVSVEIPPNESAYRRIDLIYCHHEHLESVPVIPAHYYVAVGTPAEDPVAPDLPDHAVLLGTGDIDAGDTVWSEVISVTPVPSGLDLLTLMDELREELEVDLAGVLGLFVNQHQGAADANPGIHKTISQRFEVPSVEPSQAYSLVFQGANTGQRTVRVYMRVSTASGLSPIQDLIFTVNASVGDLSGGTFPWTKDVEGDSFRLRLGYDGLGLEVDQSSGTSFDDADWSLVHHAGYLGLAGLVGTYLNGNQQYGWQAVKDNDRACLRPNAQRYGRLGDADHALERVTTAQLKGGGVSGDLELGASGALGMEMVVDGDSETTTRPVTNNTCSLGEPDKRYAKACAATLYTSQLQFHNGTSEGPRVTYGTGAPSGTPSYGSMYIRVDAPTGESGLHIYTADGWKQMALVP